MTAVLDGVVEIDDVFEETLSFCLGCRACEPVCPSMVPYGRTLEGARAEIAFQRTGWKRPLRNWITVTLLGNSNIMALITWGTALIQRTRLARLAPGRLRKAMTGLRRIRWNTPSLRGKTFEPQTYPIGTVGMLTGCIMGPWFPGVHAASISLLVRAGYRVVVPPGQTCCGALAAHDGAANGAKRMATRNIEAFSDVDYVVADAAGCSAHLKDYPHWVTSLDPKSWQPKDINELIAEAIETGRLPRLRQNRGKVALQHPCHLRNAQGITAQPRTILTAAGYLPIDIDTMCCGAAGFYSILRPETSTRLVKDKTEDIHRIGSTIVASANPGCEMHLRAHLDQQYKVLHPVELYDTALAETTITTDT